MKLIETLAATPTSLKVLWSYKRVVELKMLDFSDHYVIN